MYMLYIVYIMIQKSISITEDQQEFIIDTNLNLSRFVQSKLNEQIEGRSNESD